MPRSSCAVHQRTATPFDSGYGDSSAGALFRDPGRTRCITLNNRRVIAAAGAAPQSSARVHFPAGLPCELVRLILSFVDDVGRYKVAATCVTLRAAALGNSSGAHWLARMRTNKLVRSWSGQPLGPCDCADCKCRSGTRAAAAATMSTTHTLAGRPATAATTAARVNCARIHGVPVHPGVQLNVREPPHDTCDVQAQLAPVAASVDGAIVVLAPTHVPGKIEHTASVLARQPSCEAVRRFLKSFDVLQRMIRTLVASEGGAGFVAPFFQEPDDGDSIGVTSIVTWGGFLVVDADCRVPDYLGASFHDRLIRLLGVDTTAPGLVVHRLELSEFIDGLRVEKDRLGAALVEHCDCGVCASPSAVTNAVTSHEHLQHVISAAPWVQQCAVRDTQAFVVGCAPPVCSQPPLTLARAVLW